jgi:hypothetical protein
MDRRLAEKGEAAFFAREAMKRRRTLHPPPARSVRIADAKASAANANGDER